MKKTTTLSTLVMMLIIFSTYAQVGINNDSSNPDPSAILDVKATDKGILIPRMSTAERLAIPSPANALLVYDMDSTCFFYYKQPSFTWVNLRTSFAESDPEVGTNTPDQIPKWNGSALISGSITDAYGKIGIGTTLPSAKLDVNGKLRVRDVAIDNAKDSVLVVSGDGTVAYRDASTLSTGINYPSGGAMPIVSICCQSWMTKNLDVDTYRNGDPIPHVSDLATWAGLTSGAYCYYANDSATYASIYGKLYNWYAVNDPRGLAPEGWHIPTSFEWTTLFNCLGGESVAGGPMKEIGTTHWNSPNIDATNISGFTGLPGSFRYLNGPFGVLGTNGYWWSSTESDATNAWYSYMYNNYGLCTKGIDNKRDGFSVRCLRD